ncbi:MAG: TetR/AcrR family transcriptional regulator [Pseudomonadota bacterium]
MGQDIHALSKATPKGRVRRRKEARPGEIISAGIAEFAEYGFERARLERIAAKAGISKGTIYLYFNSKEALFSAAIEEHVLNVVAQNEAEITGFEGTTEALLRSILGRIYRKLLTPENTALMRVLIAESGRVPGLAAKYHEMALGRGIAMLKAIIERGVRRGEVVESIVSRQHELIVAPAIFLAVHNMVFSEFDEIDVEAFFESHVSLIVRGLCVECPG